MKPGTRTCAIGITTFALAIAAGLASAQQPKQTQPQSASSAPSTAEIMSSPQVQSAFGAAMRMLGNSRPPGPQPRQPEAGGSQGAAAGSGSDAMRDAAGVAAQAFGFAAQHPDATEAEKRAAAQRMMSGVFGRELQGDTTAHKTTKDYGDTHGD